ncbi:relaxase/mobilization nuclease domain-containing protein [uncultured Enterovirga sp.]|uniref:relaxase/mobilization nuclease domain-containing protein n=1 Tax=uncultured Enterovirga sp. TaxID=2026352 RepID=UPI0035C9F17C
MTRAAQIAWWVEQVETTRRAVGAAREERRSRRPSPILDDEEFRGRRGRVGPLPTPPAAVQVIRGTTICGGQDEERRRGLPAGTGGGSASRQQARSSLGRAGNSGGGGSGLGGGQGDALGRARQIAAGYQPAVIKVVSFARGVARATATGQYVQREDVPLETHDGRMLSDREAVAEEIKAWSAGFEKRAESQDAAAMRLTLHGVRDTPEGRALYEQAIASGFAGHRYAARLDALPSGALEAQLVVAMAGTARERFRVREERIGVGEGGFVERRLDPASEAAAKARIGEVTGFPVHAISVVPGASSHGRDGVTYRLGRLIEKGAATDDRGRAVANVADARIAAREWGPSLRSQSSRDTMHLIISAKAGTDVEALTRAARAFLHDRFADHRFMFGVHTDKEGEGHIHAHAVITVRNEAGQKVHPSRDTFREWRQAYAEHAQAEGLKIVATGARERASSQSYGPRDKAIVEAAERPRPAREVRDRAYAADPANRRLIDNARQRIRTARANPIRLPTTDTERRAAGEHTAVWRQVVGEHPGNATALGMLARVATAETVGGILHTISRRVGQLTTKEDGMAITSDQMAKDLAVMNEAVSRTSDLLDGGTKQQFQEASARYLETLANRIDLQRVQEIGVEQLSRREVESLVGVNADRLISRAQEVEARETREAASAQLLADRAVEVERRQEGRGRADPEAQRELRSERAVVAGTQQAAAREAREAAAAVEAARVLADHPAQPLPIGLVQTDALGKLRAEQERVLREIEAERGEAQAIKGQRLT